MTRRIPLVDTLRGFALVLMFGFHFAFDLNLTGAAHVDLRSGLWLALRFLILGLFLSLVGVSLSLADRPRPDPLRALRLLAGAALISLATWFLFPDAWVFFGVLHFVLVASLIVPPFTRWPRLCGLAGLALAALPAIYRNPGWNGPLLQLAGLGTQLPRTIDFVPLCPWLGMVLLGGFAGSLLPRDERAGWRVRSRPLEFLGRHSLLFYLAHQVILLPLAWLAARLLR